MNVRMRNNNQPAVTPHNVQSYRVDPIKVFLVYRQSRLHQKPLQQQQQQQKIEPNKQKQKCKREKKRRDKN